MINSVLVLYSNREPFLHGDFHSGNLLFKTEPSPEDSESKDIKEVVLIDWQCFGYGHPSTEFSYFLSTAVDFEADRDLKLMKIYYEELTKTVKPEEYPWEVFQREVEIRTLQLGIAGFNMKFKNSPEDLKKLLSIFEKKGIECGQYYEEYPIQVFKVCSYYGEMDSRKYIGKN